MNAAESDETGVYAGDRKTARTRRRRSSSDRPRRRDKLKDQCDCDLPDCDIPCCDFGLLSTSMVAVAVVSRPLPARPSRVGAAAIRGYRRWLSRHVPARCRFTLTCSQYGLEAVRRYGLSKGMELTAARLRRCGKVPHGSVDPVP